MKLLRRKSVWLLMVIVLSLAIVPVALAWPFGDVPVGYWAYDQIHRFSNLHITSGCGGGNFCPENYVTRAQMAVFMSSLTQAWTDVDEPFIFNIDHRDIANNRPAIIGKSNDGTGIIGISYGAGVADNGVYGQTNSTSSSEAGVYGYSSSAAAGLRGVSASGWGAYVQANNNALPDLVLGGTSSSLEDGNIFSHPGYPGSDILLFSYDEAHIHLDENNDEEGHFAVYNGNNELVFQLDEGVPGTSPYANWWGWWGSPDADVNLRVRDDFIVTVDNTNDDSNLGYFAVENSAGTDVFTVSENGDMVASGSKSSIAETSDGPRKMYAVESPDVWFEDFGSGQLADGMATVTIAPLFQDSVNTEVDYHVFLTPLGDCNGLYVTNKTPTAFEVHELNGGTSNIEFDYRIVAKRSGYEDVRLAPLQMTDPESSGEANPAPTTPLELDDEDRPIIGEHIIIEMPDGKETK